MNAQLKVDIRHQRGDFVLEARFTAQARITALSGPSGAGKTTLLHIIAGLIRPDEARIILGGKVLEDTKAGIFLPPHQRGTACVFQEARLFPHLTVRQNLLYSRLFSRDRDKNAGEEALQSVLDLLGLAPFLHRSPQSLSGGEKQRVAIGRALLANPRLLIMDEPLASLDAARKAEIFPYLERLRDETGIPILYVSHNREEIMRLASFIVRIEHGTVKGMGDLSAMMDEN